VRVKIKRRLREAVKLIVTRGAAVEESHKGSKLVFREEDIGADKWIIPGVLLSAFFRFYSVLGAVWKCVFAHDEFYADWTYAAMPTTDMLRMPFAELLGMMRQALGHLHQRIPEVESILRDTRSQDEGATPRTFSKRIHRI
jgi:hypothetical protein